MLGVTLGPLCKMLIFLEIEKWAGAESNRRHEDFQSSALPTELPAHTEKSGAFSGCVFHLRHHGYTMWESCSPVLIDES
jgi:hypothetical protein